MPLMIEISVLLKPPSPLSDSAYATPVLPAAIVTAESTLRRNAVSL